MQTVEFRNFSCFYKHKRQYIAALEDVSFSVEAGQLFVILGSSGSGKTTLLKCILGLCDYIRGQLLIDGTQVDDFHVRNSNIGFVRQELDLYPHLTVYDNIAFPLRMIHTGQDEVDRRVKEVAQLLDIHWLLTRKPKQLSCGQLQRVAIARALVKNPIMVLFDEPFSNLDPTLREQIRQLVKKIHEIYRCTILFVTHDLNDAYALAQRVLVLEDGKVAYLGSPEGLAQKGYTP